MQNKKGFTLIELLAVIVVLAIIALITVPQVLGFTDSARKGAAKTSALNYVDAIEKTAAESMLESTSMSKFTNGYYDIAIFTTLLNVQAKGKIPTSGWVRVENSQITAFSLVIDSKYVVTSTDSSNEPTVSEDGTATAAGGTVITLEQAQASLQP